MLLALAGFCISGFVVAMIGGDIYYEENLQSYKVAGTREDIWFVAGCSSLFFALGLTSAILCRAKLRKEALRLWGAGARAQAMRLWCELEGD